MSTKVGDLRADISLDTKEFDGRLRDAKGRFVKAADEIEGRPIKPKVDGKEAEKGFDGVLKGIAGAAAAGAAIAGAAFAKAFSDSIERNRSTTKLGAQLGLTPDQTKAAGKLAGEVYAENFGESVPAVNDAIKAVIQNIGGLGDKSRDDVKKLTEQAITLADVLGTDVNDATAAAGDLVKNGLASNAEEAFDLILSGAQQGANKSEDLTDTIREYAVQWKKLGLSGPQVMAMLTRGIQGGARNTDILADAMKEFSIRSVDGSEQTADAYKSLGLNQKQFEQALLAGGPAAQRATQTIMTQLANVKNPIEQNRIGLELFGTQWEDAGGKAVLGMNPALGALEGFKGKMAETNTQMSQSTSGWWDSLTRSFAQPFNDWMDNTVMPKIQGIGKAFSEQGQEGGIKAIFGDEWGKQISDGLTVVQTKMDEVFGEQKVENFKTGWHELSTKFDEWFGEDKFASFGNGLKWIKDEVLDPIVGVVQTIGEKLGWVKDNVLDPLFGVLQTIGSTLNDISNNELFKTITGGGTNSGGTGPIDAMKKVFLGGGMGLPEGADGLHVPGPKGSPQLVLVHGGETVLPTHKMDPGAAFGQMFGGTTNNRTFNASTTINTTANPSEIARRNRSSLSLMSMTGGA